MVASRMVVSAPVAGTVDSVVVEEEAVEAVVDVVAAGAADRIN